MAIPLDQMDEMDCRVPLENPGTQSPRLEKLLAGAAGMHVGRAMAFPGDRSILDAAARAGLRAAVVMAGVVVMLVIAGMLEGLGRQLIDDTRGRLIVGGSMLAIWLAYFFAYRRLPADSEAL